MFLQVGEANYPIESFSLSISKQLRDENQISVNQYRLFAEFKNAQNMDSIGLADDILNNYTNQIGIISNDRVYDFSDYIFEGVTVTVSNNTSKISINFSKTLEN